MTEKELERKISSILLDLGVPTSYRGYEYLKKAIAFVYEDKELGYNIFKGLYPKIGNIYNVKPIRVERCIRHGIETSALIGNYKTIRELFGYTISPLKEKPTNSLFICTIAEKLRLEED